MAGWVECNEAQHFDFVGLRIAQPNLHFGVYDHGAVGYETVKEFIRLKWYNIVYYLIDKQAINNREEL